MSELVVFCLVGLFVDRILLFHEIVLHVLSSTCNTFMEVFAQYKLVVHSNLQ